MGSLGYNNLSKSGKSKAYLEFKESCPQCLLVFHLIIMSLCHLYAQVNLTENIQKHVCFIGTTIVFDLYFMNTCIRSSDKGA